MSYKVTFVVAVDDDTTDAMIDEMVDDLSAYGAVCAVETVK